MKVRWGDKKDGYGEHYWEYNHGPQEYKSAPVYKTAPSAPVYKEAPTYKEAPVYKEAPTYKEAPVYKEPPAAAVYKPAATESVFVPTYSSST